MAEISASVGQGGVNQAPDVRVVQGLLLGRGFRIGRADGLCGQRTIAAIVTFQHGFLRVPDGRVDPGGRTLQRLNDPSPPPPTPPAASLTRTLPRPARGTINNGVTAVTNRFMLDRLGQPRSDYGTDCRPVTNPRLRRNVTTANVGPFNATGLTPAVQSLQAILEEVRRQQVDVYRALGTAGMLCCRWVRGSTTHISNHSWGTAVDLKLNGILDARGDDRVQYGLTLIAPIFNAAGWYWGAGFPTEDAMHFEAGRTLVETWATNLP